MKELAEKEAIAKAAALCSKKEYCVSEIRAKLDKWEVSDPDAVLDYLQKEKYIDESRYASAYVRDKFRFNKWGRIKIRHHLKQKRVPIQLIDSAIEKEINEENYVALLKQLLDMQRKKVKGTTDYEISAKLYRFAYSRGFEAELISEFI